MTQQKGVLPDDFQLFGVQGIAVAFAALLGYIALYSFGWIIYNLYFHPLKHIPGPITARASGLPYSLRLRNGNITPWLQKLHAKYGDAVRVNPNDVSFISGETAWQDIYGFHVGKARTGAFLKDRSWFPVPVNGVYSIIAADEATHSKMRRNLSHAFSDKALRDQEVLIQRLVDLLIARLHDQVKEGNPAVDMTKWYNYTTFDIISDLTFGEPLYCLRDKDYHPWVTLVFTAVKAVSVLGSRKKSPVVAYYDKFQSLFKTTNSAAIINARAEFSRLTSDKVTRRLEAETDRPDFMGHIMKNMGSAEKALTKEEIDSNALIFLLAGSETTATLLSGTTYLLLKHPDLYAKLVHEVRSEFKTQDEITVDRANKLEFMIACFQEGMRMYPPVPTGFPRIVPQGGSTISGQYIPGGSAVYVSQHAANHSPRNFKDPDSFVPNRWLGDERYVDDKRAVLNAFSFGPRNCLGKNLAYAEMRVILAKVLFNFDLELVDKQFDWLGQNKVFSLWEKPPLMIRLHPIVR